MLCMTLAPFTVGHAAPGYSSTQSLVAVPSTLHGLQLCQSQLKPCNLNPLFS